MIHNIDYEWLIKEIKNKIPHNIIEILNYTKDILKLSKTTENYIMIDKIVEVMCSLDEELRNIAVIESNQFDCDIYMSMVPE